MSQQISTSRSQAYLETLLTGDRAACRAIIDAALDNGISAYDLLTTLVWPTMELLQQLYRDDRISTSSLNLATRLNRSITDQTCARLTRGASNGKKVSGTYSTAPISQVATPLPLPSNGRGVPRWSVGGEAALFPASMAGLVGRRRNVGVGPP